MPDWCEQSVWTDPSLPQCLLQLNSSFVMPQCVAVLTCVSTTTLTVCCHVTQTVWEAVLPGLVLFCVCSALGLEIVPGRSQCVRLCPVIKPVGLLYVLAMQTARASHPGGQQNSDASL